MAKRRGEDRAETIPPQSMEAEQGVLGACLLERDAMKVAADAGLRPTDFYRDAHRVIFAAMLDLHSRNVPVDIITLADRLRADEHLEGCGGTLYLVQMMNSVPTAAGITHYVGIVKAKALKREAIRAADAIMADAYDPAGELDALLRNSMDRIRAIQEQYSPGSDATDIVPLWEAAFTRLRRWRAEDEHGVESGLRTGLLGLDSILDPLSAGDYMILAARPSAGKTILGFQIASNAAKLGRTALFFSAEMSEDSLAGRALSTESGVDGTSARSLEYRRDHEDAVYDPMLEALARMQGIPLYVTRPNVCSPATVLSRALACQQRYGLGLLVVDYLQLLKPSHGSTGNQYADASSVTRDLKAVAGQLGVPLVCLSQLNRSVESRPFKRPRMSDLRDSGAIEEDADVLAFLYRPGYYPENNWQENRRNGLEAGDVQSTEVIIAKQRNGIAGVSRWVRMLGGLYKFEDGGGPADPGAVPADWGDE
jgi:replicative DNA helicase